ncbi:MAG: glutathione S-transferase family protein [Deltaproteobacteria bacterium]|nr:glutathione S-transferase family protein [Deltaproteobacteria bacterium]MBW2360899.1 glutathione S-transferase family protein [Deltaproteobacteria bacterium]
MGILLHGANGSPFVRKVRVILEEKSLSYEQDPLVPFGVSDEYKQKSPLGKIPCLEDDDYVLPDSSCIGSYLERAYPKPELYPEDARGLGRALWFEEYGDTKLVEVCTVPFFERIIRKGFLKQAPDEAKVRQVLSETAPPVFDYLEGQLGDADYLVGGLFSIADIAIASPFRNLRLAGEDLDVTRWPKLSALLERVLSRPSFKAISADEEAFFSGGG